MESGAEEHDGAITRKLFIPLRQLGRTQRAPGRVQHHRAHDPSLTGSGTPTLSRVTTTDYEAVPTVERDAEAQPLQTVVMKFGGSSVADADKLKSVARRLVAAHEGGTRVVAVLSAMGRTTVRPLGGARTLKVTSATGHHAPAPNPPVEVPVMRTRLAEI